MQKKTTAVQADPYKQYKRQKWITTSSILVAFVAAYTLWNLYFLVIHYNERVQSLEIYFTQRKAAAEAQWQESCKNKPHGFATDILNCTKAQELREIDVMRLSRYEALSHLQKEDITFRNLVFGCHDTATKCDSRLARFLDTVIDNVSLMLWTTIIAGLVLLLVVFVPGKQCWKTIVLKRQTDACRRFSSDDSHALAQLLRLTDQTRNADDVYALMRNPASQEIIHKTSNHFREKQAANMQNAVYIDSGEDYLNHSNEGQEGSSLPAFPSFPDVQPLFLDDDRKRPAV